MRALAEPEGEVLRRSGPWAANRKAPPGFVFPLPPPLQAWETNALIQSGLIGDRAFFFFFSPWAANPLFLFGGFVVCLGNTNISGRPPGCLSFNFSGTPHLCCVPLRPTGREAAGGSYFAILYPLTFARFLKKLETRRIFSLKILSPWLSIVLFQPGFLLAFFADLLPSSVQPPFPGPACAFAVWFFARMKGGRPVLTDRFP